MAERKEKTGAENTGSRKGGITPNSIGPGLDFASREAFKRLRTNVMIALPKKEGEGSVVGITSAQPNEGKSTVTANLAYALAENGQRVLLVDADLHRPSIHVKMGMQQTPGLTDLLTDSYAVKSTIKTYAPEGSGVELQVLTAGDIADEAAGLVSTGRMKDLLKALRSVFDYIVLDLPPVDAVVDAVDISLWCDGMIVVVRDNNCPRTVLQDCMDQLTYADANVLGFVMNGIDPEASNKRYSGSGAYGYGSYRKHGYGYGYGYGYGESKSKGK